jgi:aspartate/methionine/tyrosine aminotransferase
VLIPAPYYSAFDNDLRAFGEIVRVPVALDARHGWALTPAALDAAAAEALARTGRPPRALLLTNPHNPLGR